MLVGDARAVPNHPRGRAYFNRPGEERVGTYAFHIHPPGGGVPSFTDPYVFEPDTHEARAFSTGLTI